MIKKWLKLNSCFVELLKNSATLRNFDQQWIFDHPNRHYCYSPDDKSPPKTPPVKNIVAPALFIPSSPDPKDKPDGEKLQQCMADDYAANETPAETKIFEIKGPNDSAFLIEVQRRDYEEVKKDLFRLKGDFFHFDKSILTFFILKCILAAEPKAGIVKNPLRLAKIHAISSGCEDVFAMDGVDKFFFVNSMQNKARAKKMLEKLGYRVTGIMYRFQPREKVVLEDRHVSLCMQFLGAVSNIPKVLSVTHNIHDETTFRV